MQKRFEGVERGENGASKGGMKEMDTIGAGRDTGCGLPSFIVACSIEIYKCYTTNSF